MSYYSKRIILCIKYWLRKERKLYDIFKRLRLMKLVNMNIHYNGKIIYDEIIKEYDNFIGAIYSYFDKKSKNPNFVDISSFSNIMNLYCNNLSKIKKVKIGRCLSYV